MTWGLGRRAAVMGALAVVVGLVLSMTAPVSDATAASAPKGGQLWAWGSNTSGMLGDGSGVDRYAPVALSGMTNVVKVVTQGFSTFAIRADGTVWSWGNNYSGQLGDGTVRDRKAPVRVKKLTKVVDVVALRKDMYALRSDGSVWAWGTTKERDGRARTSDLYGPRKVAGLCVTKSLATNYYSVYAVCRDGRVYAWGLNSDGQLGDGTTVDRTKPRKVAGLTNVTSVTAIGWSVFAIRKGGSVWTWGAGRDGGLGDGTTAQRRKAKASAPLKNLVSITGNGRTFLGVRSDGSVMRWGGKGKAVRVAGIARVSKLLMTETTTFALKKDGTVWAWGGAGSNKYGQLGTGKRDSKKHATPARVPGITKVKELSGGFYYVLARRSDGTVWTWGSDANPLTGRSMGVGSLGLCGIGQRSKPTKVAGITNSTRLVTGGWTTFAIGTGTAPTC